MVKLSVSLVKPKNLLKTIQSTVLLEDYIIEQLKGSDLSQQKCNPDLILFVCKVIENWFHKYRKSIADEKISKKEIAIRVLKKLIPSISQADESIIIQIIEHLHSSGRIKITSLFKWLKASIFETSLKKE